MESNLIKEIDYFFSDEDGRKEFMESIVNYKDNKYLEDFISRVEPYVDQFSDKSKLFFCYLWLKKTNFSSDDLPFSLLSVLVPQLRIYEVEKSGIRMGSKKRYPIDTGVALSLARKYLSNDKDFEKWLNKSYASFTVNTIHIFFKYREYYPFFKKNLTVNVVSQVFWSKEIIKACEETPDFGYVKEILEFEKKNRLKLIDKNFSSYIVFYEKYLKNHLNENEKWEIFEHHLNKVKQAESEVSELTFNKSSPTSELIHSHLTNMFSGFKDEGWRFAWERYLNDKDFKKWNLHYVKLFSCNTHYSLRKCNKNISGFELRSYMLKMGLSAPDSTFFDKEDIYGITNKKAKFKELYNLSEEKFNEITLSNIIYPNASYNSAVHFGLWFNFIPFEAFIFFKKEFPYFLRKGKEDQVVWDESAKDLFVDYILYSDEEMSLTEHLKEILILNHKR